MATSDHRRIAALESLRGVLALWVVLGHLLTVSGLDAGSWTGPLKLLARGIYAVDVFIILSGFVIWMLLDRAGESYAAFILRRFFRLFPIYLLCLLTAILTMPLAVDALQALPWENMHNAERLKIFTDSMAYFPAQFAAHILMIHGALPDNVLPSSPYAFVGQAWSISLEWQFYLIAPLLFWWSARGKWVFVVLGIAAIILRFLAVDWPTSSLPPQFVLFAVGMLSYEVWKRPDSIPRRYVAWLLPAGVVGAAISGMPALLVWTLVYFSMLATRCGSVGSVERIVVRVLEIRHFRFLGEISYSLYLSHMVVIYIALYALAPYAQMLGKVGHFALLTGSVLCLSIAGSYLLYRYVELPGIQTGKRLASRYGRSAPASVLNQTREVRT